MPVATDYCGLPRRSGAPDRGALEYPVAAPCDTSMPGVGDIFFDGFETGGTGQWSLRIP